MNNPPNQNQLSHTELLSILALSPNANAIYTGEELMIQFANDAMLNVWGRDRSVIGMKLEEALPELDGQPFIQILKNVWHTGISYHAKDTPAQLKKNATIETFYFDFSYQALLDKEEKVYAIFHTFTDVTERNFASTAWEKAREHEAALYREQALNEELAASNEELTAINEELQQAQDNLAQLNNELEERVLARTNELLNARVEAEAQRDRLNRFFLQAPAGICILDGPDFIFEMVNKPYQELLPGRDLIGKPLMEVLPEAQEHAIHDILKTVYSTGQTFEGRGVLLPIARPGDGKMEERYFDFIYQARLDYNGAIDGILVFAIDVTDAQIAQKELKKAEEMLRLSVEAGNVGIWYMDEETHHFLPSLRLKEMFGFAPDEDITYEDAVSRVIPEHKEKVLKKIRAALAKNESYEVEYQIHYGDPVQERWLRSFGKMFRDHKGTAVHMSGIAIDITEQKEDEIRKNDFIGMVSHELKTPLTSLSAYVQMLLQMSAQKQDHYTNDALMKVNKQIKKMTSMINGFLNVSRLESGKIHLNKSSFNLDQLVKDIIDDNRVIITGHALELKACDEIVVYADHDKIGSVIANLLSNAAKYSPGGTTIEVTCNVKDAMVMVCVRDYGIGIPEDDIEKLFERYYRVQNNHSPQISGFGIGLYLCAEIITRHKGKIWVESVAGQGSCFYFSLPLAGPKD